MDGKSPHRLKVIQIGMHERGAGGGVERIFWDLVDQLAVFSDLAVTHFSSSIVPLLSKGAVASSAWVRRPNSRGAVSGTCGKQCLANCRPPAQVRLWLRRTSHFTRRRCFRSCLE
jgi:hypothetical protein